MRMIAGKEQQVSERDDLELIVKHMIPILGVRLVLIWGQVFNQSGTSKDSSITPDDESFDLFNFWVKAIS